MKRIVLRWRVTGACVAVLAIVFASARDVGSRQPQRIDLSVLDGRPLAAAILELENRFGWVITYEDPPYEWTVDVEDVTLAVSKSPKLTNRVLVPRLRSFAFRYPDTGDPRPSAVLPAMLRDYHQTGNGDEFRLIVSGSMFHMVPSMSANERGIPTPRQSRLDVAVTLNDRERSARELIEAVLAQVRAATGIRVVLGANPINLLMQTKLRLGAENEAARDVLVRAFAATGRTLSWRLFCDPGSMKTCALNVHVVPPPK